MKQFKIIVPSPSEKRTASIFKLFLHEVYNGLELATCGQVLIVFGQDDHT